MKADIKPDIRKGCSITQIHLCRLGEGMDFTSEIHIAHYPEGDIKKEPQYYNIIKPLTAPMIKLGFDALEFPEGDRCVIEQLLGNFYWVRYYHTKDRDTRGGKIYLDTEAMAAGEWVMSYF